MDRDDSLQMVADPAADADALATEELICLWCALRSATADPAWPRNDPAADRRALGALFQELWRRGKHAMAEDFFLAARAEAEAMAQAGTN
jgi:hypothetical protein